MAALDGSVREDMKDEKIRRTVREKYAKAAKEETFSCCSITSPPRSGSTSASESISRQFGYSQEDIDSVPEGSNLGLGCGNPIILANLKRGETVLDLGSGAGFDCFLAANRVGGKGKVIGVDMTPEMIEKARKNARKSNYHNVEFRLGEIENLPVADGTVDVVISNCVINLSPDKKRVFEEAFRVLKHSGRLIVSDIILLEKLPKNVVNSVQAYTGCIAGAETKDKYIKLIENAGFQKIKAVEEKHFPKGNLASDPIVQEIMNTLEISADKANHILNCLASLEVSARKI